MSLLHEKVRFSVYNLNGEISEVHCVLLSQRSVPGVRINDSNNEPYLMSENAFLVPVGTETVVSLLHEKVGTVFLCVALSETMHSRLFYLFFYLSFFGMAFKRLIIDFPGNWPTRCITTI